MEAMLLVGGGLVLLVIGGEAVVRGAVGAARRLGVSELLIGLTLVGFGTSAPELLTSVKAALAGAPGISIGNVLGSNIANILLIFALVAIIRPVAVEPNAIRRDGMIMIAATVLLTAIGIGVGELSRWIGALLLGALVGYLVLAWFMERDGGPAAQLHEREGHTHDPVPAPLWLSVGMALVGLGLLVFGANLLVTGAVEIRPPRRPVGNGDRADDRCDRNVAAGTGRLARRGVEGPVRRCLRQHRRVEHLQHTRHPRRHRGHRADSVSA